MTTNLTELEIRARELELKQQDLDLQRAKLFIEFAKFGFSGTLTAAIVGMVLIFALASLSAFTTFKIDTWGLVVMSFSILVGSTAFGYLSLWEVPRIAARLHKMQMSFSAERDGK